MSLLEQRRKLEEEQKRRKLIYEENRRKELALKILKTFEKAGLEEKIEELLIKDGGVYVDGFGCLCQGGFCTWQKGFTTYLHEFEQHWRDKGVSISYQINGLYFRLDGANSHGRRLLNPETFATKWC